MSSFKRVIGKTWVFGAAAIILAGSSLTMAFTFGQGAHTTTTALHSSVKHIQTASIPPKSSLGYTVINESKQFPVHPPAFLVYELTGFTTQQQINQNKQLIEQKYRAWIANHTPSVIDMSAQQAAACAAAVVEKAYGLNLKGYIAKAEFAKLTYINSRQWDVEFYNPKVGRKKVNYQCAIDAVTGSLIDLYANNAGNTNSGNGKFPAVTNTHDPAWVMPLAKQDVSKILPKHVSITSTRVVAHKNGFVYLVTKLSDGSAIGISLKLDNKFAYWYHVFPNGYDGSWAAYNFPG